MITPKTQRTANAPLHADAGQITPQEWRDIYPELKLNIDGNEYISVPSRQGHVLVKVAIVSAIDSQPEKTS